MSEIFKKLFTDDGETRVTCCSMCGRPFKVGDPVFVNDIFGETLCDGCYEEEEDYTYYKVIGEDELIENAF